MLDRVNAVALIDMKICQVRIDECLTSEQRDEWIGALYGEREAIIKERKAIERACKKEAGPVVQPWQGKMTEREKGKRIDWIFWLSRCEGVDLGSVGWRAAERAVRNRIGVERMRECVEHGPYFLLDEDGREIEGRAEVAEYDADRLAIELAVQREYYLTMGIDIATT